MNAIKLGDFLKFTCGPSSYNYGKVFDVTKSNSRWNESNELFIQLDNGSTCSLFENEVRPEETKGIGITHITSEEGLKRANKYYSIEFAM